MGRVRSWKVRPFVPGGTFTLELCRFCAIGVIGRTADKYGPGRYAFSRRVLSSALNSFPSCAISPDRNTVDTEHAVAFRDGYPVAEGIWE